MNGCTMAFVQPRSQGLSSLPPLVVGTETLVAAGHVTIYPSKTAGCVSTQVHLVERKTLLVHPSSRFFYHPDSGWSRDQPQPGSLLPQMPLIEAKTKLPKLTSPKFRRDVTKWISFRNSFKSEVHEKGSISAIDKFNYLNSLLEGHASRAIQGLSLTEANYKAAIEILNERFGRKQQIISAHMYELLKLPSCLGTERSTSLRNAYDKISVHVRGLASLGVSSEQYGELLTPVIMAKLPGEVRVRIARETKGSN